MSKPFYITTTLPYVNAEPHIGFALEIVQADIIARYKKLAGFEVFFNTGTDEHGVKIYRKAVETGKTPQAYADEYADKFRNLKNTLGLSDSIHFIRTTDEHHKNAAREFWKRCKTHGYIDKKLYKIKYCVGCELEKTDSELSYGKCPLHPNLALEVSEEENYFFKFKLLEPRIKEYYEKYPDFVVPDFRFNEIKAFLDRGLEDFSISRLKEKMPWGVPVPDDDKHVMYVWFDALVSYISTLGWPEHTAQFEKFWGTIDAPNAIQVAGKDQIRQQAAMWQAMLMAAGLPTTKQIVIHGFITSGGEKMSKSLGNVVDPVAIVKEYGTDALRYYLARHIHPFEDSDFTMEKFKEAYNADLANGLGNLVARIMQLSQSHLDGDFHKNYKKSFNEVVSESANAEYVKGLEVFELNRASNFVSTRMKVLDEKIATEVPFQVVKCNRLKGKELITVLVHELYDIALLFNPFLPSTSEAIIKAIAANKKPENLFPRK